MLINTHKTKKYNEMQKKNLSVLYQPAEIILMKNNDHRCPVNMQTHLIVTIFES